MDFTLPPDLVTAHAASLRALARSLAIDEHAADDVVQETWLRALSSPPVHREGIGGWLRRVAEGFALKRHRSESRRADRERKYALERPEAVTSAGTRAETLRVVVDAVLSLEDPYRETVLLRWFEGLPPRDIAARTGASVATVNSRLQRAHAMLRDRLSRRLGLDDRKLQGVLLAIFGTGTAKTAAAASISLFGVTMTITNMMLGAGVAAAGLCAVVFLKSTGGDPPPVQIAKVALSDTQQSSPVLTPDPHAADDKRVNVSPSASASVSPAVAATEPGPYLFDVTIIPLDATRRPLASVEVRVGFEGHQLALLGKTEWNGELHATWRGSEPSVDFVLEASRSGMGASGLRHVHFVAGPTQTLVLPIDGARHVARVGNELVEGTLGRTGDAGASKPRTAESNSLLRLSALGYAEAPRRDAASFVRDATGNGVFQDAWVISQQQEPEPANLHGARIDELRIAGSMRPTLSGTFFEEQQAQVSVTVRDEHGRPLANEQIEMMAEGHAMRSGAQTDAQGHAAFEVPFGRCMIIAGGDQRVLGRADLTLTDPAQSIDHVLQAAEIHTVDLVCRKSEITRVRLLTSDRKPLANWHVESRATDALETLIARGDTDGNGVVELQSNGSLQRLYVRAESGATMPLMRIPALVDPGAEADIVPLDDAHTGSIFVKLTTSAPEQAGCEARLWSTTWAEGVRMLLKDVSKGSNGTDHVYSVDVLLPGSYVIEYGAPGAAWRRVGPFNVAGGQDLDAGTYTLASPAIVDVAGAKADGKTFVIARTRVQGLVLEGQAMAVQAPSHLLLTPGEWTLGVSAVDETRPKVLVAPSVMKAEAGGTLTLDVAAPAAPR